jgi:hypothetical protein
VTVADLSAHDSFFANETESNVEQNGALRVQRFMRNVQSLIPRISERQGELLREKLSDYVAMLIEKNAAKLAKYEKPEPDQNTRAD